MGEDVAEIPIVDQQQEVHIPVNQDGQTAEAVQALGETVMEQPDQSVANVVKKPSTLVGEDWSKDLDTGETRPRSEEPARREVIAARGEAVMEEMAEAEDDFRTKAVQNRDVTRMRHEERRLNGEANAADRQPLPPRRYRNRKLRQQLRQDSAEADRAWREVAVKPLEMGAETSDQYVRDFSSAEDRRLGLYDPEARAERYDTEADRVGEWAAILSQHPISEEVREAFERTLEDAEITPLRLVRLEDQEEALERKLMDIEDEEALIGGPSVEVRRLLGPTGSEALIEGLPGISEMPALLWEAADESKDQRWKEITTRLTDDAKELDVLRRELLEEVKIKPIREQMAAIRSLLDAVWNRQTSETPATSPSAEADDQPQDS